MVLAAHPVMAPVRELGLKKAPEEPPGYKPRDACADRGSATFPQGNRLGMAHDAFESGKRQRWRFDPDVCQMTLPSGVVLDVGLRF